MGALGLHQLVPRSLLARRCIVVLVCYLDDSGKDPQNPITTLAGYAATDAQWSAFETEVEPIFTDCGVRVLHTKDLHHTDGEFEGWRVLKKQAFVARICMALAPHVLLGMSASAAKKIYAKRANESDRKRTITPYAWCFNLIVNWVLTDIRLGRIAHTEGVAFILECGHQNNAEAVEVFHDIRRLHEDAAEALRSITFVPKEKCRAIQMADLLAFYSRRHGVKIYNAPMEDKQRVQRTPGRMLDIIAERIPHRPYVATDFGPDMPNSSRFFGGPLDGE
jgi:hypothetical protein